jgi:hypothetical protein
MVLSRKTEDYISYLFRDLEIEGAKIFSVGISSYSKKPHFSMLLNDALYGHDIKQLELNGLKLCAVAPFKNRLFMEFEIN